MTESYEQRALELIAENVALKAQVNSLLKACKLYGECIDYNDIDQANKADEIVLKTPEQCLNSVRVISY